MKPLLNLHIIMFLGVSAYAQKEGVELPPQKSGTAEIYDFAEINPEFPGGEDSLHQWIETHFNYPAELKDSKLQGRVYVRFEVLKNGSIVNPQIIKGLHEKIDKELIRVLRAMPNWIPGQVKGRVVIVRVVLPIEVKLKT